MSGGTSMYPKFETIEDGAKLPTDPWKKGAPARFELRHQANNLEVVISF